MRHFLSRRWIVIHLLTLTIVVVCVSLALWQLGRLEHRRGENARLEAQMRLPVSDIDRLLTSADAGSDELAEAGYRTVRAEGTFDSSQQVILQSRGLGNKPGNHLLTPLVLQSGEAVLVDRGWVPLPTDDEVLAQSAPPAGAVKVEGVLLPSEERGFLGVSDPPPGRVTAIPRIDLERLAGQLPYPLYPLYLRLLDQQPANSGALPEPVPIPPPDEGPHRDYALQWFAFAGTALIIYLGLMRRERDRLRQAGEDP
ncbi:MAG TPA: SURF1 family protein, partial [Actinomycetota bacterium]|nr:SURF1 family protein [Actinomycetota bacterium]